MTIKTVKDAINDALVQSFEEDKNVILMGEDIAGGKGREQYQGTQDAWGGPFGVTQGLYTKFGGERVRDTTIAEAGFFGGGGTVFLLMIVRRTQNMFVLCQERQ